MTDETSKVGALSGLKVLDLSRVLAGPWAAQTLADLGAEVIKVERPGVGDDTRAWGPPYFKDSSGERSAYYLSANRGKQSICINLNEPRGQQLVRELAQQSDVLIENFKTGDLARRGLDYDTLKQLNPALVYCSITGFGQTGPYSANPGYDFLIQAMGGLMSITGDPEDESGPQKVGVALADVLTGLYSTIAILAALKERDSSGLGQYIDMALLDVQVAALANQAANFLVSGQPPGRLGNAHPNVVPYQSFATHDGFIIVAVGNNNQFERLCQLLQLPDLPRDERFRDNADRVVNRHSLAALLQAELHKADSATWLDRLRDAGVPCGPINSIDQTFAEPQVASRGLKIDIEGVPGVASPIRLSRTPVRYQHPPPHLGEHTREVLQQQLGISEETLAAYFNEGVIA